MKKIQFPLSVWALHSNYGNLIKSIKLNDCDSSNAQSKIKQHHKLFIGIYAFLTIVWVNLNGFFFAVESLLCGSLVTVAMFVKNVILCWTGKKPSFNYNIEFGKRMRKKKCSFVELCNIYWESHTYISQAKSPQTIAVKVLPENSGGNCTNTSYFSFFVYYYEKLKQITDFDSYIFSHEKKKRKFRFQRF